MDARTVRYFSPAKLNLFLHITGKRDDGYHNLQSVFCRLAFGDTLTFCTRGTISAPNTNLPITLTGANHLTTHLDDNLIIKSARALAHYAAKHRPNTPLCAIDIHLDKVLPTGAGLGGGSSNAATTLIALNALWSLNLDKPTLIDIAKTIGADVPFFILETPSAIAEGIGEQLTPIALPPCRYLLICPPVHNPTGAFFANPALPKDTPILSHAFILNRQQDFTQALNPPFFNAFEAIALTNPDITHAYRYLCTLAKDTQTTPRLTGTGSTVFLPITPTIDDDTLKAWQQHAPYPAFLTSSY